MKLRTATSPAFLLTVLTAMTLACGGESPQSAAPSGTYVATRASGFDLPAGVSLSLRFADDGRLAVTGGCNSMGGTAAVRDGRLEVEDLVQTLIGCPAPLEKLDFHIASLLQDRPTVAIDGDSLTLTAGERSLTLVRQR
jgi:heat shock protein HslJ